MNKNDNIDSDENIDDIEQKMSFLDTFLSDDDKKEPTQIEEHSVSNQSSLHSNKQKKIHSIKEYMKRKPNYTKNISPYDETNMRRMQYVSYGTSFLVFLIICYCLNLFSLLMVMIPVLLVFYLLNENRAIFLKRVNEKNIEKEKEKMEDLELAQCLLNI